MNHCDKHGPYDYPGECVFCAPDARARQLVIERDTALERVAELSTLRAADRVALAAAHTEVDAMRPVVEAAITASTKRRRAHVFEEVAEAQREEDRAVDAYLDARDEP